MQHKEKKNIYFLCLLVNQLYSGLPLMLCFSWEYTGVTSNTVSDVHANQSVSPKTKKKLLSGAGVVSAQEKPHCCNFLLPYHTSLGGWGCKTILGAAERGAHSRTHYPRSITFRFRAEISSSMKLGLALFHNQWKM